ncbi:pyridoxal-phosphate dependent enzyme [Patescibacteria group bacterium]|nr:pyridoxal-phosphate dependent enzyme [Patescibacteria group bacterium]
MSNFQNKINKQEKGIWRYAGFYDEFIEPENRLSLGSNRSRIVGAKHLRNVKSLYFKREDENLAGSLKNRSLAYQVSLAKQNGEKELVISTSGNAGIAAAAYCQEAGIKLYVFISPETEKAKIKEMQKYNSIIIKSKKAIRLANYLSAKYKIENLRPSTNDSSIEGFKSIAFEIFENLGEVDAIFTFVTSGSSFVGIGRAYKYLLENKEIKKMPRLHAVQSGEVFSVVELSLREARVNAVSEKATQYQSTGQAPQSRTYTQNNNLPGKLGIKNTRRKKEILELIKLSGGKGIYVNDQEVQDAKNILENNDIYTSLEGCASFAGVVKASKKNKFNKIMCILSGKLREEADKIDESKIYKAENFVDVDEIVSGI